MFSRILFMLIVTTALAILAQPSRASWGAQPFTFVQTHMGASFTIRIYADSQPLAKGAADAAFARIAELEAILSDYRPDSELMKITDRAVGKPVVVGDDLFFILQRSAKLFRRTEGAFDPTVGPIVRLWRKSRRIGVLPPRERIDEALTRVGFAKVQLDGERQTIQLAVPDMQLDAGGIAKGYASDEALKVLKARGFSSALVAGAGDIVVGDPPPGRLAWRIGIGPLKDPRGRPQQFLNLHNQAVSTSGDAEQYVEIEGVRYSHIVDPRTGVGLTERISATVVAPDGATADSLATSVCVMGAERGLALIESLEACDALVQRLDDVGDLEILSTDDWPDRSTDPSAEAKPADAAIGSRS